MSLVRDDCGETGDTENRRHRWLPWLGGLFLLECLLLTGSSWNPPDSVGSQVEDYLFRWVRIPWGAEGVPVFFAGMVPLYALYFLALARLCREPTGLRTVLLFAAGFRLALLPGIPILETDINRYLWDGRVLCEGINPFRFSPAEVEMARSNDLYGGEIPEDIAPLVAIVREDPTHEAILSAINNKKVPTIYMPTTQLAFAAASVLARVCLPESVREDPLRGVYWSILVWKTLLLAFEAATLWLLVVLLRAVGRDPRWVIVYAWSPLVLKEYVNTGHFDPLVLFSTLLAIRILITFRPGYSDRSSRGAGGAALAFGIATKLFPLFFIPLLVRSLGRRGCASMALVLIVLFAPFLPVGTKFLTGLATYGDRWENNSSLVAFLEWGVSSIQDLFRGTEGGRPVGVEEGEAGQREAGRPPFLFELSGVRFDLDAFFVAKTLCLCLFLSIVVWSTWSARGREGIEGSEAILRSVFWITGALLICSPTVFPWYVAWMVPFLCFVPSRAWLYLTFAVQVYYLRFWVGGLDNPSLEFLSLLGLDSPRWMEYLPFFALLGWEGFRSRQVSDRVKASP